ncbi:autotransporter outer membrane beta-barrel domain-containing protein [Citrobacter sp. Cpo090]|uniref:autotransporter outer membrane beta-barrel domain-containing protein n=1 Tax=Citrobacter sp. Cpo090 TaxID=2985139 RepID=UPI002578F871|nr:autotransporter outer membrane beta-barrel domain-containing protein [Citrobacter sp. Cpo090]MDM2844366.1 autotransporter outer membrane beta-barrel domain-containing protein [Citrobacter sp. Cpo090]
MNKTYSIVWSTVRNMYVVASELARSGCRIKTSSIINTVNDLNSKATHNAALSGIKAIPTQIACAVIAALIFASPAAQAGTDTYNSLTNYTLGYIDELSHDMTTDGSPDSLIYSDPLKGSALYVAGDHSNKTSVTGDHLTIETTGGLDGNSLGNAIFVENNATLQLTNSSILSTGIYSSAITAQNDGHISLTDSTVSIDGSNYGTIIADKNSDISLTNTTVNATGDNDVVAQNTSSLTVNSESTITLAEGQVRIVNIGTLNMSDSTVSSTGIDSTVRGYRESTLKLQNSAITHTNTKGAAIEASNATTLDITGDKASMVVNSAGIGVYGIGSAVNIDGATINAENDGIKMTSVGQSPFYADLTSLSVKNATVTSDTAALHVDSNTKITSPITLTDVTLTGPTAIMLDSKTTVEATDSTLNGDVTAGMTSSTLSLKNSTLNGKTDAAFATLSLDENSQWNLNNKSYLGTLTSNGKIDLIQKEGSTGSILNVDSTLTLQDQSQLAITMGNASTTPVIKTSKTTLAGDLTVNATATFAPVDSDKNFSSFVLIDSSSAINGDFDSLTLNVGTPSLPDYLTLNAGIDAKDNTNYVLSEGLSWNAGANSASEAHGTFTIAGDDRFEVVSELSGVNATTNWDGETLTKEGDGTLILSNTNNNYGATQINAGTLASKNAATLGRGDVTISQGATLQLSAGTLDNTLVGEGVLKKDGSDSLTLTADNSDYSGDIVIADGTLIANETKSLGTSSITDNGVLQLDSGTLNNQITGTGSLLKDGSGSLVMSSDNSYSGGTVIKDGEVTATHVNALGSGDVDNSGTLLLNADGKFDMGGAQFVTHSDATTTLAAGSTLNVKTFTQETDSTLNIELDDSSSEAIITADDVALGGSLNISGIGNIKDPLTNDPYTFTLIDANNDIQGDFDELTIAGMEQKSVDFLTVDGKINENDQSQYLLATSLSWYADRDNAATDAHGTFTLSDPDGSFTLGTDLTDVNDTLNASSTTGWDGKTLTKEGGGELILSGNNSYSGGTFINEGTLTATSENALGTGLVDNNSILVLDTDGTINATGGITTRTDSTTVLTAGTSLNLGQGSLIQESGSTLDVELNSNSIQPLITGSNAELDGTLHVNDVTLQDHASDKDLKSFTLMDMDNDISGNFAHLSMNIIDKPDYLTVSGMVNPDDASQYLLAEDLSWNAGATSATAAHGNFTLDSGKTFEVTSSLADRTGNSDWDGQSLTKMGAGELILSGNNTYSGTTDIQEGTLWLAGTGTIGAVGSQQTVNIAAGATFGGSNEAVVNGNVDNKGTLNFGDSEETNATFFINGDLTNSGTLVSGSSTYLPGNTLHVEGNYIGNEGSLYLNTELGDDSSATDKLVVTGDTSGNTTLYIHGIGNQGAQTTTGIEVVDIGGESNGVFKQGNQVQAGLYEYRLYKNESNGDWYLSSQTIAPVDPDDGSDVTPVDPDDGSDVTPVDPDDGSDVTPVDPDDGSDVTPINPDNGGNTTPQYRADIGAYLGNQWMARSLQMQTLYDREGSQYRSADGSVWAHFKAGQSDSQAVSGNLDLDSNYSEFQLGGDILAWDNGQQSLTIGVMASYINADTDSTGNRGADGSQFTASGNVDGYNLGVYATWFADAQTHRGLYMDSWYQYGIYNNSVENGDVGSEEYDSTANAISLETGYRYDISLNNGNTVSLTPQAQIIWQNYDADSVTDNNGTRIDGQSSDSWTTRMGLRVDGKLYKDKSTVIQPFMEANWLHTNDETSVSFDGTDVQQDLPANRAELKVGIQADINKQWNVRAQISGQKGSNDFGDINGSLNLRYNW